MLRRGPGEHPGKTAGKPEIPTGQWLRVGGPCHLDGVIGSFPNLRESEYRTQVAGSEFGGSMIDIGEESFPPRILNITTPQVGHFPLIALRPFFISSWTASAISFFALHLTQYPSGIKPI